MQMVDPNLIDDFIHAGNATFTLVGQHSRYTFKVQVSSGNPNRYFVSLHTGPDDYNYIGMIEDRWFRLTHASKLDEDSQPILAFTWAYRRIVQHQSFIPMEFWHDGRCGKCRKVLTVPESIARGLGPQCVKEKK